MTLADVVIYALWGVIMYHVSVGIYNFNTRRSETKYLRHLSIQFPDAETIKLSAVESSDRKALKQIKEQLDELA